MVTGGNRDMECRVCLYVCPLLEAYTSSCPDLSSHCYLHSFWTQEEILLMPIAVLWELQLFSVDPNKGGQAAVKHRQYQACCYRHSLQLHGN